MATNKSIFIEKSKIAFDLKHRKTINYNISKYDEAVRNGKKRFERLDLAKKRASFTKDKVISNLAGSLIEFEKNAINNGIKVIWARDGKEAIREILDILKESNAQVVVKSKSMISEELHLNENIEKQGIESVETDLGEFIVQLAGEKPYHILTPAMHKSKEDVALLFSQKYGLPEGQSPDEITDFVRKTLRRKFTSAEVGITGANFLIADCGGIILTENEGNGFMTVAFPKIHIVISGIEKILPSISDLGLFLPLLASMGTGQQLTVYNSLITGPKKDNETNGPDKMIVVLLDNKRSDILATTDHFKALKCIRCGACLNACPIYKNIGGYTYNSTYTGPIGSVITPYLKGFSDFGHLSYACTICGACSEVCPVKIPLHYLLLLNRKTNVELRNESVTWNLGMKVYEKIFSSRKRIDFLDGKIKNKIIPRKLLGNEKEPPEFAHKSFAKNFTLLNK